MNYKRIPQFALLIALAFVLSYAESLISVPFAIPGMKLGLTNIVVLFAIYKMDVKSVFIINIARIVLSGLMFGTAISFCFSLSGGIISAAVMLIIARRTKLSKISTSIAGGIFHNVGQMLVAMLVLRENTVAWYFVALWFSGLASGAVIGYISGLILNRWSRIENSVNP